MSRGSLFEELPARRDAIRTSFGGVTGVPSMLEKKSSEKSSAITSRARFRDSGGNSASMASRARIRASGDRCAIGDARLLDMNGLKRHCKMSAGSDMIGELSRLAAREVSRQH